MPESHHEGAKAKAMTSALAESKADRSGSPQNPSHCR